VFLDESGFMLQPVVRRTWAPRGHTPIHTTWDRHDRLSVIGGVTVSPRRRRLDWYFTVHGHNVVTDDVIRFVRQLRRHVGPRLLLVWDRLNQHRSTAAWLARQRYHRDVVIEWLPGYAPQLNPAELVWSHTKYGELANNIPDNIEDLRFDITLSLARKGRRPDLLRAFFRHAGLPL
jgi:transposase